MFLRKNRKNCSDIYDKIDDLYLESTNISEFVISS